MAVQGFSERHVVILHAEDIEPAANALRRALDRLQEEWEAKPRSNPLTQEMVAQDMVYSKERSMLNSLLHAVTR